MGKRGPARQAGKREASGRLSRQREEVAVRALKRMRDVDQIERDTLAAGMASRIHEGVRPELARDQFAGSFVGRLYLGGELTRIQLEAAEIYFRECQDNSIACASPSPPRAVDLNRAHGSPVDAEDVGRTQAARQKYDAARRAVMEKQIEVRGFANLFGALSVCVLEDHPATNLIGDLRIALNALAKHYKVDKRFAA